MTTNIQSSDNNTKIEIKINPKKPSSNSKILILVVAVLTNLLAGGFVFGFSSLLVILRRSNVGISLCNNTYDRSLANTTITTCTNQELSFARIFLAGNIAAIGATLPIGILMDSYGPKATAVFSFLCMITGSIIFASTESYALAFGFMGFAAPGCIMSTFHTTNLFPLHRGLVMAIVNSAYDSSSVVLLVFLGIYTASSESVQLPTLFFGYAILLVLLLLLYVVVMPRRIVEDEGVHEEENGKGDTDDINEIGIELKEKNGIDMKEKDGTNSNDDKDQIHVSVSQEVFSIKWLFFTMFFSTNLLRFSYYLAQVGPSLIQITSKANSLLGIFGSILPCGFIISPGVGWILDNSKQSTTILIVLVVGVVHSIFMLIPTPVEVQIGTFVLFTVFRSIFFSIATTFAIRNFPPKLVGRVFGLTTTVGAIFSITQYPLVAQGLELNSFIGPNVVVLLVSSFCSLPLFLWLRKQEKQ